MVDENQTEDRRHLPRSPVTDLSYDKFGSPTRVKQRVVTVTTSVTEFIKPDPNRVALLLINNSSSDVYISFDPTVSSSYGVPIGADGGSMKMSFDDYGEAITAGLYGVASSTPLSLTLIEVLVGGSG